MRYAALRRRLPPWLLRHVLHFESVIEQSVTEFGESLAGGARVLDAGAGEARHRSCFPRQSYVAFDLAVGDASWDYTGLDACGDLAALPFPDACFDAVIHIVTLEHVRDPRRVTSELGRVLKPGGRLLLVAPHEWEEHQAPHDYFRFTRFGLAYLLAEAGFADARIEPVGGFFRLLSRRLLNALQFFPGISVIPAALFFVPPALVLPLLDGLDRTRAFTLGYTCSAVKRSL